MAYKIQCDKCISCGACAASCPVGCISQGENCAGLGDHQGGRARERGCYRRAHPRGGKVRAAREPVSVSAVWLCQLRDWQ